MHTYDVRSLFSPGEKTIGWLAKEASERYYRSHNLRPVLKLTTKDGALLSAEDYIVHLLTHNEEVIDDKSRFQTTGIQLPKKTW